MKICLLVCWYGPLPNYFPIWLKSCASNLEIQFLVISDHKPDIALPDNVRFVDMKFGELKSRIEGVVGQPVSIERPYRLCDFRPMYGLAFSDLLTGFDFWGYCDMDVVFGKICDYINEEALDSLDAVFNGGQFSIFRNCTKMNMLFMESGALLDYRTVVAKDAIFAFDETTGIQRIARKSGIAARYGVPYIEADGKYPQLRSRTEAINPAHQAFYWERGKLYRVKYDKNSLYYQNCMHIHLQKRKLALKDLTLLKNDSFWILPDGFCNKEKSGFPTKEEIDHYNPPMTVSQMKKERIYYNIRKIVMILKRNPYQIYVRIKQQKAGINAGDASAEDSDWVRVEH